MYKRYMMAAMTVCTLALGLVLASARPSRASDTNPWKGQYYQNRSLSGVPAVTRDDPVLTFVWGYDPPIEGWTIHENFSVRWTITDDFLDDTYTFAVLSDDGVRMFVDGRLIIDAWYDQEHFDWHQVNVSMTAGKHTVKVEYYQHNGWAQIQAGYYPALPDTATTTGTPGPSPTPFPPTLAPTPAPTETPSLFGTIGLQPTTVHQPPPSFGGGTASVAGTPSPFDRVMEFNVDKSVVWDGFPGPAYHLGGQAGVYGYVKNRSVKPTFHVQWGIVLSQGGYYDAYAFIPSGQNVTHAAAYQVLHNNELSPSVVVDQSANGEQWVFLGSFYFISGKSADQYVYLDNQTGEETGTRNILLDAVRLVYRP